MNSALQLYAVSLLLSD